MPSDHVERSRAAYGRSAELYVDVIGTEISDRYEAAEDRALLGAFVELAAERNGLVVDAGCGPGRVTRFLADAELDVVGVDVAPGMIEQARLAHPDLSFQIAELSSLPFDDGVIAAATLWYSIITTPAPDLGAIWSELARVVQTDGAVMVAFQCGSGEPAERPNAYGTTVDLTLFRHEMDVVCAGLEEAAFGIRSVTRRSPIDEQTTTDQAFIIAVATAQEHCG